MRAYGTLTAKWNIRLNMFKWFTEGNIDDGARNETQGF